jgi:hypothetical protein
MRKFNYTVSAVLVALHANAIAAEDLTANTTSTVQSGPASVRIGEARLDERSSSSASSTASSVAEFFGLRPTVMTPLSLSRESSRFSAPYLGLSDTASSMTYSASTKDGGMLRLSRVTQAASASSTIYGGMAPFADRALVTVEVQKAFAGVTGAIALGQFRQTESVLSATGSNALSVGGSSHTTFVSLSGTRLLSPKLTLSTMATIGRSTTYELTRGTMLDAASVSRSGDLSLGIAQKDVLKAGDSLGFTLALPLRNSSTFQQVSTAGAQNQADSSLRYMSLYANTQQSGIEKDLELSYITPLLGGNMTAMAQLILQPRNETQTGTQFGLGLRYIYVLN